MFMPWRSLLIAVLALTLLPSVGRAATLDQAALMELESLLRDLGFDPGVVDGVVDDDTLAAIQRYQDFALLPGEPAPDARLLDELRGVAAAFAALNAGKAEAVETMPEKVIVPPPPPSPKLTAPEIAEAEEEAEEEPAEAAALPLPQAAETLSDENLPPDVIMDPALLNEPIVHGADEPPAGPVDDIQTRIDAELLRFLHLLNDSRLSRETLARQFNDEGRGLLQQAHYDEAILKFSVAIHLKPDFAGAYSNRGTAYQRQQESMLAKADFDKAKELGFDGFRAKDAKNPLN
jgi:peptidoglycan hydrolase-like protein with peptidoglycan-binding domain